MPVKGTCLGYDILTERDEIKRNVGYMTQRFSLYADLSIRENLDSWRVSMACRIPGEAAAPEAIGRLGLMSGPISSPANCRAAGSSG